MAMPRCDADCAGGRRYTPGGAAGRDHARPGRGGQPMPEFQRTRVREREPGAGDVYEQNMRLQLAIRERSLTGPVVIRGDDRPFQQTRQGRLKFYLCRGITTDVPLKDWHCFVLDVQRHSGKHRHQGGLAIFVLEGEGYSVVDGERIDWTAG